MREGILVQSSNRGRYAIGDPDTGPDLTTGNTLEVLIGGRWIPGSVAHAPVYAIAALPHQKVSGYFFVTRTGETCGFCAGMRVRTRE